MSKNPYEIRLETLKMAKEMADQQFQLQMDFMHRMMDENQETGKDLNDAYDKYVPDMYKPEEIVKRANELYAYVSEKKQEKIMAEVEKKNGIVVKNEHNEFELALRFLGNELIAIKMAATNFSGKLIVWSILLLLFSFMLIEVFEVNTWLGMN